MIAGSWYRIRNLAYIINATGSIRFNVHMKISAYFLLLTIFLMGCGTAVTPPPPATPTVNASPPIADDLPNSPPIPDNPTINPRADNRRIEAFNQLIGFDAIRPIYDPAFTSADASPLLDEELVMGIAWGSEAKAYPVTVLRFREMVNDELAGIPILVSW